MKVVLLFVCLVVGGSFCLNVPPRSGSRSADACFPSPCGKDALCKYVNGLTQCYCGEGFKGDPFVKCSSSQTESAVSLSTLTTSMMPSSSKAIVAGNTPVHTFNPSVKIVSDVQQPPIKFTVEYKTSTDTIQDISRIPILGSTLTPQFQHQMPAQRHTVNSQIHETVMQSHVQRRPPQHFPNHDNNHHFQSQYRRTDLEDPYKKHGLLSSLDSIVADPMGQYSNCRTINGVIACADNSVNDTPSRQSIEPVVRHETFHKRQGQYEHTIPNQQSTFKHHSHNTQNNGEMAQNRNYLKPEVAKQPTHTQNGGDCSSMCGINAICRMINSRPVCGCPVTFTGDPGVRCVPEAKEEEKSGCQKHTECSPEQVCIESKCIDPCSAHSSLQLGNTHLLSFNGGSEMNGGMCGKNAKCVVIQHTPLCGCNDGFYGNPYVGCVG